MTERVAVFDLGSNSLTLLVAACALGDIRTLGEVKRPVGLAQGRGADGTLSEAAMARALHGVEGLSRLARTYAPDRTVAVATAAVRDAPNREVLLSALEERCGIAFEVISGEQEAHYDYLGAMAALGLKEGVLMDIGGGSTELVAIRRRRAVHKISIPVGSLGITDSFLRGDPPSRGELAAAGQAIERALEEVHFLPSFHGKPIVAVGGTMRALVRVHRHRSGTERALLHGYEVPFGELSTLIDWLLAATDAQRRKLRGLNKTRVRSILGGALICRFVGERLGPRRVVASGHGLRDGIVWSTRQRALPGSGAEVARLSAAGLLNRFGADADHAAQVVDLALSFFDALHGQGLFVQRHRLYLELAARLHDIGLIIDFYRHDEHGAYIVRNAPLLGLSQPEVDRIAQLIAAHEEEHVKVKKEDAGLLACLRLAEMLSGAEAPKWSLVAGRPHPKLEVALPMEVREDKLRQAGKNPVFDVKIVNPSS